MMGTTKKVWVWTDQPYHRRLTGMQTAPTLATGILYSGIGMPLFFAVNRRYCLSIWGIPNRMASINPKPMPRYANPVVPLRSRNYAGTLVEML